MKLSGWITLLISWSAILSLTFFAIWKTLRAKPRDLTATLEIEAQIEEEERRRES